MYYPYHPHASRRTPCGTLLLKNVRSKTSFRLLPVKVYPYKKLKHSIERLVRKEGFLEKSEHWRKRAVPEGYLYDIYEGNISILQKRTTFFILHTVIYCQ